MSSAKNKWFYRLASMMIGGTMFFASVLPVSAFTVESPRDDVSGKLAADTSSPQVSIVRVNPPTFNPKNDDTTITFSIDKQAFVSVKIMNGRSEIKSILDSSKGPGYHDVYWAGVDNSNNIVSPGTYQVRVTAANTYGSNTAYADVIVSYPTGPKISNLTVSPSSFDPKKTTGALISYNLDQQANVSLKILKSGSVVRQIMINNSMGPGLQSHYWTGNSDSNQYVEAGSYTVQVTASNTSGSDVKTANVSVFYESVPTALDITSHDASPSMFDPYLAGTTIRYSLNKPAYVTVRIMQGNNVIKYLKTSVYEQSGTAPWDGKYSNGNLVAEGTYTYEVFATVGGESDNAAGNIIIQYGTQSALLITNHYVEPKTFDPYKTSTTVYYTMNKAAYVTIRIKSGGDSIVKTIQMSTFSTGGFASWDGRNSYGDVVPEGTYQYEVSAYSGNQNVQATGYVTVDVGYPYYGGKAPYISSASVSPNPFNPYFTGAELKFTLSGGEANVTVEVFDRYNYSSEKLVATLLTSVYKSTGTHYVTWNGKNYYGNVAKEGAYTFKITASNSVGTDTRNVDVSVNYSEKCEDQYYCPPYNVKPYVYKDYASPNPFKIGGGATTSIYFAVTTSAKATVTISKSGSLVRTIQSDGYVPAGTSFVKWDGKDYKGNYVSVGTYMYKIYAENSYGSDSKSDYLYVTAKVGGMVTCGGYSDVDISSPYCKAIIEMGKLGIFEGYGDGTFGAYNPINRAETVKVILRALNKPIQAAGGSDAGFFDVKESAWYMNYVYTARVMGVINGYPDGSFKPAKTVNRVELLKIFLGASGTYLPACSYAPYADTPASYGTKWYLSYVCYSKKYTLVDADSAGNFGPGKLMKRGDVADLFYRYQMQNMFNKVTNPPIN